MERDDYTKALWAMVIVMIVTCMIYVIMDAAKLYVEHKDRTQSATVGKVIPITQRVPIEQPEEDANNDQ